MKIYKIFCALAVFLTGAVFAFLTVSAPMVNGMNIVTACFGVIATVTVYESLKTRIAIYRARANLIDTASDNSDSNPDKGSVGDRHAEHAAAG